MNKKKPWKMKKKLWKQLKTEVVDTPKKLSTVNFIYVIVYYLLQCSGSQLLIFYISLFFNLC